MKKLLLFIFACYSFNAQSQVTNGLVAKYSFNNGNANDEIGTNNGMVNGATPTTDRFGNADHAYFFDGIDDYISFGDAPEFQMGNADFCISLWIYYWSAQNSMFLSKRAGASGNFNMYSLSIANDAQLGGVSEKLGSYMRSSGGSSRNINAGIQSGAWHHVVLYHDYSDSTSIIVDGVSLFSSVAPSNGLYDVIGEPFVLGFAEDANALYFNGVLDDIRIYKRLLTPQEIDSLYNESNPCIFNPIVNISGVTLTAAIAGASYQWIDCSNNSPISNATSQSYTPTLNGNYAVIVSQNNCTDTSNCITISTVGINESRKLKTEVYPNPANNRLNIDLASEAEIEIYAITGKIMDKYSTKQNHIVDISAYPNGMYFVKTENETIKFVKQ